MFPTAVEYPSRRLPYQLALGDFNGDGKPDIAVLNVYEKDQGGAAGTNGSANGEAGTSGAAGGPGPSGSVSVLLSNANTGYAASQNYLEGNTPNAIAVGDLNGDGKPDLAVSNSHDLSVLFNSGDGTLLSPVSYSTGTHPLWVAIGDLNGDGKADLAVLNFGGDVAVLLNMGSGTFVAANYPVGTNPFYGAMGDLNGDGRPDLVVATGAGLGVLLNNGNGTFAAVVNYGAGTSPGGVAIGDLNGDGKPDLALLNFNIGGASVLINVGNGVFAAAVDYPYAYAPGDFNAYFPGAFVIGDLNGDGKPDLVSGASSSCGVLAMLLNGGSGTFAAPFYMTVGPSPVGAVVMADLNGDGKLDLVVTNADGVGVLLNAGH